MTARLHTFKQPDGASYAIDCMHLSTNEPSSLNIHPMALHMLLPSYMAHAGGNMQKTQQVVKAPSLTQFSAPNRCIIDIRLHNMLHACTSQRPCARRSWKRPWTAYDQPCPILRICTCYAKGLVLKQHIIPIANSTSFLLQSKVL